MRTRAGVTYLAGDHLGSASLAMGATNTSQRYYPYGGTRSGGVPTDYQFTGQKNDTSTGLYYFNARYYDPVTGRFVSADTIVPAAGKPQDLNRYAYVRNNPVRNNDPTGHCAVLCPFILGALMIAPALAEMAPFAEYFVASMFVGRIQNDNFEASIQQLPAADQEAARFQRNAEQATWLAIGMSAPLELVSVSGAASAGLAGQGGARFAYQAQTHNYRNLETGRFVSDANLPYPSVDAAFTSKTATTLRAGTIVDRYGPPGGQWAAQPGATASARGLPPGSEMRPYSKYRVLGNISDVTVGPAAPVPEFGAAGGALQYLFPRSIRQLLKEGLLEKVP